MIFKENFKFYKKKNFHFNLLHLISFVITAPKTLNGSWNVQSFALIRAVWLFYKLLRLLITRLRTKNEMTISMFYVQ